LWHQTLTIVEDLARDSLKTLKNLAVDESVGKAWSMDRLIRFTLASDKAGTVKRVKSIYDPIDTIIANAM
jgi:hypothetical protein